MMGKNSSKRRSASGGMAARAGIFLLGLHGVTVFAAPVINEIPLQSGKQHGPSGIY